MELSSFEKLTVAEPLKKFQHFLWNQNVHYRFHERPPLVPMLTHMKPIHISYMYSFSKIHFSINLPSTSRSSWWSLQMFLRNSASTVFRNLWDRTPCHVPTHSFGVNFGRISSPPLPPALPLQVVYRDRQSRRGNLSLFRSLFFLHWPGYDAVSIVVCRPVAE
jgi:hypothetical protein